MVSKITTEEFRSAMRNLPPIIPIGNRWDRHRRSIRNHTIIDDPAEFLKWSTISATMHVGINQERQKEYDYLMELGIPHQDITFAITDTGFGAPDYLDDRNRFGTNYIHQAFKLSHLQTYLKSKEASLSGLFSIAEFGGGYGAMSVVIRKYGFFGEHHFYDYPELLLLQRYYLSNLGLRINAHFYEDFAPREVDLLIGIMSLSESPLKTRIEFLNNIKAKYYFIQFQQKFFEIDNHKFFSEWADENLSDWIITDGEMKTHYYLIGER